MAEKTLFCSQVELFMKRCFLFAFIVFLTFCGCKSHKSTVKTPPKPAPQPSASVVTPYAPPSTKPIQSINLPIFIPVMELQTQIYQVLFAPGYGKYYPCASSQDCDRKYKDLYLENPIVSVKDKQISIKLHLAGNTHVFIFNPGISDDITLTATPFVQNDTLYFKNVTMEQSSGDLLLNLSAALFKDKIEQKLQQNAWYAFGPSLDAITNQAKKQFPVKWGGAVLLLNLSKVHLNNVTVQAAPDQGIMANFSADLEVEDSSFAR